MTKMNMTPPSHEECLAVLRKVYKLLSKTGPGARKRMAWAMDELREANDYYVMTYNMLNREAGEFPIHNLDAGGCCDPATETYHSM